jgi:hypothetical protein
MVSGSPLLDWNQAVQLPRSRLLARVTKVRQLNQRAATLPRAEHLPTSGDQYGNVSLELRSEILTDEYVLMC